MEEPPTSSLTDTADETEMVETRSCSMSQKWGTRDASLPGCWNGSEKGAISPL